MIEVLKQALEALEVLGWQPTEEAMDYRDNAITAIKEALAQPEQEPEFVTHNVDKPYDWSEWVCPNPSGYLMKCCDCGLVHEAEFGVVRYKSETEREDCDMVNDPNLQAVFRMRRSEEWSPKDTAYRPGGLAQPAVQQGHEHEPVAWMDADGNVSDNNDHNCFPIPLYTTPPQRTWVGLTDEEKADLFEGTAPYYNETDYADAIEAKLKQKNGFAEEKNT